MGWIGSPWAALSLPLGRAGWLQRVACLEEMPRPIIRRVPGPTSRDVRVLQPLPRSFYARPVTAVAPELLGHVLHSEVDGVARAGVIVEVEAYAGHDDAASHAAAGKTRRNATMFGPPGRLYVYFTYGMHWCANAVCEGEGTGAAVLIRALRPLLGEEHMAELRPAAKKPQDLCSGPAKLAQALGLDGDADGLDLTGARSEVRLLDVGHRGAPPHVALPRIGIRKATRRRWRFCVPDDPNVSRPRP